MTNVISEKNAMTRITSRVLGQPQYQKRLEMQIAAGPSVPGEVLGWRELPSAGLEVLEVDSEVRDGGGGGAQRAGGGAGLAGAALRRARGAGGRLRGQGWGRRGLRWFGGRSGG